MDDSQHSPSSNRRDFFKQASAIVIGGLSAGVPLAAGLPVLFDPLRRKSEVGESVRIATLEALPSDGVPRKFTVVADKSDAWNHFANVPVGAVYLRRLEGNKVEALNVVCPHAGCFVDYVAARNGYFCPCHNSTFKLDGTIAEAKSPSPRAMDTLPVEIRNGNEIWVRFQNFRAGLPEKVPIV
jgi:menaquinol-cytochrome c reductase iron-sulfur subunit